MPIKYATYYLIEYYKINIFVKVKIYKCKFAHSQLDYTIYCLFVATPVKRKAGENADQSGQASGSGGGTPTKRKQTAAKKATSPAKPKG